MQAAIKVSGRRFAPLLAAALLLSLVGGAGGTLAAFSATTKNPANQYSAISLTNPTGLVGWWNGTNPQLAWTAPVPHNGNGYEILGVNNAGSSACPAGAASYTTNVGSTAATAYTDSTSAIKTVSTYVCYDVQEGYNIGGAPPWGAPPTWNNTGTQATVPVWISPIGLVQSNKASAVGSNTNITVNWAANTVAGHLLVVAVGWGNSARTVSSVKYNNAVSFTAGPTVTQGSQLIQLFYLPNAASETTAASITVAFNLSTVNRAVVIGEFKGLSAATTQDVSGTSTNASAVTSASVSTSAATTAANELAVIAVNNSAAGVSQTFTPPQKWMDVGNTGATAADTIDLEWSITGATGIFTGSDTWNNGATDAEVISVFKP